MKKIFLQSSIFESIYGIWSGLDTDSKYRATRDRYWSFGYSPSLGDHILRFKNKVESRGYKLGSKSVSELRVLALIPSNWSHQTQIYIGLSRLVNCVRVDYRSLGLKLVDFQGDSAYDAKLIFFEEIRTTVKGAETSGGFDLIISYLLPWDSDGSWFKYLSEACGCPMINISLDDKNWWGEIHRGHPKTGLVNIVNYFDLTWTSARISTDWHWFEGAQAVYLAEGVNTEIFAPSPGDYAYDLAFVGSRFGERGKRIDVLRRKGLNIFVAGPGWPNGVLSEEKMIKVFQRSRILLGMGDIGYSRELTNLKGRDFECPSIGMGAYLTTYNSQLAECFNISSEILCYKGDDELVEIARDVIKSRRYLEIGKAGRIRCERDHTWTSRFRDLFQTIGLFDDREPHHFTDSMGN